MAPPDFVCSYCSILTLCTSFRCCYRTQGMPVVYFEKDEFPEMDKFMKDVMSMLGIKFMRFAVSYRDGMQALVDSHNIKVSFVALFHVDDADAVCTSLRFSHLIDQSPLHSASRDCYHILPLSHK